MGVSNQEKLDKEFKRVDQELGKKTAELHNIMTDLDMRVKSIEDELNDDDDPEGANNSGIDKPGPINFADDMFGNASGEEDVNMGDVKKQKSGEISPAKNDTTKAILQKAGTM